MEGETTPAAGEETTSLHETQPGSGVMIDTGTKIINLAEIGGNKYIRINVVLEFAQPAVYRRGSAATAAKQKEKLRGYPGR